MMEGLKTQMKQRGLEVATWVDSKTPENVKQQVRQIDLLLSQAKTYNA